MTITPVRIKVKQNIPDLLPDTQASRRLRELERGAELVETAIEVGNAISSLNPILPTTLDLDPTVNGSLEQIGDSNWYGPPNEAVDPWNCELWPNSPYCGGNIVDPLNVRELGFVASVNVNPCETCLQIDPTFLGISGPSGIYCYRSDHPDCQSPASSPSPTLPKEHEDLELQFTPPFRVPGQTRIVMSVSFITVYTRYLTTGTPSGESGPHVAQAWRQFQIDHANHDIQAIPGAIFAYDELGVRQNGTLGRDVREWFAEDNRANGWLKYRFFNSNPSSKVSDEKTWRFNTHTRTYLAQELRETASFIYFRDFNCSSTSSSTAIRFAQEQIDSLYRDFEFGISISPGDPQAGFKTIRDFYPHGPPIGLYDLSSDCIDLPPPANQPLPRPAMGCCDETLELLEAIYAKLGVDEFPVKAPPLLIQEDEKEIELANHAQLWEWTARNLDAVMGQFPIKIQVKDSDPTQEGNQEIELNFPNVAETLAELFGLVYQAEINTDLITEILLRIIPEVIATKNASLIGQSYAKANASFLGYPGNAKEVPVDYNFDLEESKSLPRFLRESQKRIIVHEDASQASVLDILAKLEFAAGIIKSAFYVKPSESNRLLGAIETLIQDEALSIPNKEQWRDWLQRMNRDAGKHNAGQSIQPEIIEDLHEGFDRL
ncbi:MAG: hypothetical protein AAGD09_10135 [Cyanobacteria bacterium P01_F01_bin.56]